MILENENTLHSTIKDLGELDKLLWLSYHVKVYCKEVGHHMSSSFKTGANHLSQWSRVLFAGICLNWISWKVIHKKKRSAFWIQWLWLLSVGAWALDHPRITSWKMKSGWCKQLTTESHDTGCHLKTITAFYWHFLGPKKEHKMMKIECYKNIL